MPSTLPDRVFGVTTDVEGISQGIIANSLTFNKSVETADARNEKGQILDIAAYSKQEELSINGLAVGTGVEPGTVITVGDNDYLVASANKSETNTAFQTMDVTARRADDAVLHSLSSIIG